MNKLIQFANKSLVLACERSNILLPTLARVFGTTNVNYESKTNLISRKLGIPERPKKPLTGYLRFLNEIRPTIEKTVKTQREIPTIAATQWKKLDESKKQKYNLEFEKEKAVWLKKIEAYEKSLTKEQKLALKDERIRLKELESERAKKLELKTHLKKLGKPKRPMNAFLLFHVDETKKTKTNAMNSKAKYYALAESQKTAYTQKATVLLENYRKALMEWEKRMVAKGMSDLVSKRRAVKPAKTV